MEDYYFSIVVISLLAAFWTGYGIWRATGGGSKGDKPVKRKAKDDGALGDSVNALISNYYEAEEKERVREEHRSAAEEEAEAERARQRAMLEEAVQRTKAAQSSSSGFRARRPPGASGPQRRPRPSGASGARRRPPGASGPQRRPGPPGASGPQRSRRPAPERRDAPQHESANPFNTGAQDRWKKK